MYVFLRPMSSNEDPAARRDQEVKETEEVGVGERSAEGGEHEAVGGGDGTTTDVAGVMEGIGGGEEAAAAEDGVGRRWDRRLTLTRRLLVCLRIKHSRL